MEHDTSKSTVPPLNDAAGSTKDVLNTSSSSHLTSRKGLRPIDFTALRRQVSMQQVLELLQWRPASRQGPQLRGPCPVHHSSDERSRSFAVHLEKAVFHCFKPGCPAKGNQLDLYALATGLPILEAAQLLCERLGLPAPVLSSIRPEKRKP